MLLVPLYIDFVLDLLAFALLVEYIPIQEKKC